MKNILFVPGNKTSRRSDLIRKSGWKEALEVAFLGTQINMLEIGYDMWKRSEVENLIKFIVEEIKKKEDILLVGYSFGGLAIKMAYARLDEQDKNKIIGFVTLGTPHKFLNAKQSKFVESFGIINKLPKPVLAIGGYFDIFAFPFSIKPKGESLVCTKNIFTTHRGLFLSQKAQRKIIEEFKKFIQKIT